MATVPIVVPDLKAMMMAVMVVVLLSSGYQKTLCSMKKTF
jgi:hypothetical protein